MVHLKRAQISTTGAGATPNLKTFLYRLLEHSDLSPYTPLVLPYTPLVLHHGFIDGQLLSRTIALDESAAESVNYRLYFQR